MQRGRMAFTAGNLPLFPPVCLLDPANRKVRRDVSAKRRLVFDMMGFYEGVYLSKAADDDGMVMGVVLVGSCLGADQEPVPLDPQRKDR